MDVHRPIRETNDLRIQEIDRAASFFKTWENDVTSNRIYCVKKNLMTNETREDVISALVGFTSLCKRVLPSGIVIVPGYLNSDLVENMFCQQRGILNGANTNPTLQQYGPGINAIVLGQVSVSRKANTGGRHAKTFNATTPRPLNQVRKSQKKLRL